MAVKIRLKRIGAKKKPFYRVVVADNRYPRNGRFIEEIGYYNPISEPKQFKLDAEKFEAWVKNGAQPTDTVARLVKAYDVKAEAKEEEKVEEPAAKEKAEETEETSAEEETEA